MTAPLQSSACSFRRPISTHGWALQAGSSSQGWATNDQPRAAGGSKKGSQVNYVRQTPKFLQAHAHLLGRGAQSPATGAEGAPEGATIAALEDEPPEDDWDDDGVSVQAGQGAQLGRFLGLLCWVTAGAVASGPAGAHRSQEHLGAASLLAYTAWKRAKRSCIQTVGVDRLCSGCQGGSLSQCNGSRGTSLCAGRAAASHCRAA